MAEVLNLPVLASSTLHILTFLVFIWCFLSSKGNIFMAFSFFKQRFANFKHKDSLFSTKLSMQRSFCALL